MRDIALDRCGDGNSRVCRGIIADLCTDRQDLAVKDQPLRRRCLDRAPALARPTRSWSGVRWVHLTRGVDPVWPRLPFARQGSKQGHRCACIHPTFSHQGHTVGSESNNDEDEDESEEDRLRHMSAAMTRGVRTWTLTPSWQADVQRRATCSNHLDEIALGFRLSE